MILVLLIEDVNAFFCKFGPPVFIYSVVRIRSNVPDSFEVL